MAPTKLGIACTEHPRVAQAFIDYMATLNIDIELTPDPDNSNGLWLYVDAEQHSFALQQWDLMLSDLENPKYMQASWQLERSNNPLQYQSSISLWQKFIQGGGWFTHVIITICFALFALLELGFAEQTLTTLLISTNQQWLFISEPWRIVTPAFLHFSSMHILFNLVWWWLLGGAIEKHLGRSWLLIIFFGSAMLSNLGQFLVDGPLFGGLSGVVYALVSFTWITQKLSPSSAIAIENGHVVIMLAWLILGYTDYSPVNMANTAHLVGLISGALLASIRHYSHRLM